MILYDEFIQEFLLAGLDGALFPLLNSFEVYGHTGDPGSTGNDNTTDLYVGLASLPFSSLSFASSMFTATNSAEVTFPVIFTNLLLSHLRVVVTRTIGGTQILAFRLPLDTPIVVESGVVTIVPIGAISLSFGGYSEFAALNLLNTLTCIDRPGTNNPSFLFGNPELRLYESGDVDGLGTQIITQVTPNNVTFSYQGNNLVCPNQVGFGYSTTDASIGACVYIETASSYPSPGYLIKKFDPPIFVPAFKPINILPNQLTFALS